tara:strand:- start:1142 stop:1552 length:411 start_codon:yes stop_codon:yes gene_type:complete
MTNLNKNNITAAHMMRDLIKHWQEATVQKDDKYVWDLYRAQDKDTWIGLLDNTHILIEEGYQHPMMSSIKIQSQINNLYKTIMSNRWDYVMSPKYEGRSAKIKSTVWGTVRTITELTEQALIESRGNQYRNLFDEN